jgi:formamidopyrimidine-DNA glycosylase
MAELPEIKKIADQMYAALTGRQIGSVVLKQPKCSNVTAEELDRRCTGRTVRAVFSKGKWIFVSLDGSENILISLGMGGDILYYEKGSAIPDKYQIEVKFTDSTGFTIRFWWFGNFLIANDDELKTEPHTKDISLSPFDDGFTFDYFRSLLKDKKGQIKAFLMDQKNVSGIGNMYMHDILFKSSLHPKQKISDMTEEDCKNLYDGINQILNYSRDKGAFAYENDFYGCKGTFTNADFIVGYKEGKPCPKCGEKIQLIKTGSTTSFICPKCQKIH